MTDISEQRKREAAARALELVEDGMVLGLGTGSTVAHFLDLLADALDQGRLREVVGVPSSVRTGREARELGIPLTGLGENGHLHLTVDGADEIDPDLDLIKGMGGALLREKMIAQASDRYVIIGDDSKWVERLGTRSALPVEVIDWGWQVHVTRLESLGATVSVRTFDDGPPFKSDNGNLILDCRFEDGIDDPAGLAHALEASAGVVDHGLFLSMADGAFVAGPDGVRTMGPLW